MNQIKGQDSVSLGDALERYFSSPAPRKEFLTKLEHSLQDSPVIASHSGPRLGRRLTFRPAYAFLAGGIILLIAFFIAGPGTVLAAVRSLTRYIPGFGLVDEPTALRALAEPVVTTREGVTLTVVQAVASPERTSVTFTIKGLPSAALLSGTISDRDRICSPNTELILPDGSRLNMIAVGSDYAGSGYAGSDYQWHYFFPTLPEHVDHATLALACLPDTLTGKAPGNWLIPLNFVTASFQLTQMPVSEITPTGGAEDSARKGPVSLEKVIETEDGYIFTGRFRQVLPAQVVGIRPEILDGNGRLQGYTLPGDIDLSSTEQAIAWAYQIHEKNIAWPVTIRFPAAQLYCPEGDVSFDAGDDPKEGQVWTIDRDYSLGPCHFHLDLIQRLSNGYRFSISDTQNIDGFQVSPHTEGPSFSGGPGQSTVQYPDHLNVSMIYNQAPPKGWITVFISLYATYPGPWQVQWQP